MLRVLGPGVRAACLRRGPAPAVAARAPTPVGLAGWRRSKVTLPAGEVARKGRRRRRAWRWWVGIPVAGIAALVVYEDWLERRERRRQTDAGTYVAPPAVTGPWQVSSLCVTRCVSLGP